MAYVLDLALLAQNLREAKEEAVEAEARTEVNPYLLNVILHLLMMNTPPKLSEIDSSQFKAEDPGTLVCYCSEHDSRARRLLEDNKQLCDAKALCAKARAFL